MTIQRVGVVGGGLMGSGIVEVCARAGVAVVNVEISDEASAKARDKVEDSLRKAESRGKLSADELAAATEQITFTADLPDLAGCDLVVEAATEHEPTKLELFGRIGEILTSDDAILASNTSSIPIVKLAAVSGREDRVMGVHFFNPAPVMKLVELIPAITTSESTKERMQTFVAETLGKHPIEATDRAGFVVNSLLVPYLFSAIRMYEGGHASAEDIDAGMVLGCGHPMGPLKLADMVGLDTLRAIGDSLYDEFKEPLHAPPPLLDRMVEAGRLGTKSGQGFYSY